MGCCSGDNRVKPFKTDDVNVEDDFDGPLANRSCRDVICLIIFLLFWVGMGYVAVVSIRDGQPERLIFGADSFGNVCGRQNQLIDGVPLSGRDLTDRPFVFMFSSEAIQNPLMPTKTICVSSCPETTLLFMSDVIQLARNRSIFLCEYNVTIEDYDSAEQGDNSPCPNTPVLATVPILNRCFPTAAINIASSLIDTDWLKRAVTDVENSWRELLYLCAISFGLALVVLVLLRFFAGVLIWTVVFGFIVGSLGGTGYLWYLWWQENNILHSQALPSDVCPYTMFESRKHTRPANES